MGFFHSLKFYLALSIIIIMSFSLVVISSLNYYNFEKDLDNFVQSRFLVIAKDLKTTVEYGLNLGLGLAELKTIQHIIEVIARNDKDISSLFILDMEGRILFHSDPSKIDKVLGDKWMREFAGSGPEGALFKQNEYYISVMPLINNFDVTVGLLVLSYPQALLEQPKQDMLQFLLHKFVVILAIFSIVAFLVISFFAALFLGTLKYITQALDDLLHGSEAKKPLPENKASEVEVKYWHFHTKTNKLLKRIDELEQNLVMEGKKGARQ